MVKDIIKLALLGSSRLGKTTLIALLAGKLAKAQLIALSLGKSGRTRTTVDYLFRSDWYGDNVKGVEVTSIYVDKWSIINYMQDYLYVKEQANKPAETTEVAVEEMIVENSEEMLKAPVKKKRPIKNGLFETLSESESKFLRTVIFETFGFNGFEDSEDPVKYVESKLKNEFSNELDISEEIPLDKLKKILNFGKIDKIIKRVVISVAPAFRADFNVLIRDTRGLLDLELDDENKITNTDISPRDIGLDDLDAIVMVCSENYEANMDRLYKRLLSEVMKSIPIFFIKNRVNYLFEYYEDNRKDSSIKAYIHDIQNGKISMFKSLSNNFLETYSFLANFGVTFQDDSKQWHLKDWQCNDESRIKFCVPMCDSLLNFSTDSDTEKVSAISKQQEIYAILDNPDIAFCSNMVINVFEIILFMLDEFFNDVGNLFKSSSAKQSIVDAMSSLYDKVSDEINDYANEYRSKYIPRITGWSQTEILDTINDSTDYTILGPRDGIVTRAGADYVYGPTVALAVACKRYLYDMSEHLPVDKSLSNSELFKKGIQYIIYHCMADLDATYRGELFINRYEIRDSIRSVLSDPEKFKRVMFSDMQEYIFKKMQEFDYSTVFCS